LASGWASDETPFIVMELIHGVQIATYCEIHSLPLDARVRLMQEVLAALAAAHRAGVVHRDLKPENLLVGGPATSPQPKIIDFGLAKSTQEALNPTLTMSGQLLGTVRYMSPEQIDFGAKRLTPASDLYSIGVIAYELLVGHSPYIESELATAPSDTIRNREPLPIGQHIAPPLANVLLRSLRKEPRQRYATAEEFSAALGLAVAGRRVEPRLSVVRYRVGRVVRTRPRTVWTGATLTVLLALSLGGLAVISRNSTRTRQDTSLLRYTVALANANKAIANGNPALAHDLLAKIEPESRGPEWGWLQYDDSGPKRILSIDSGVSSVVAFRNRAIVATLGGSITSVDAAGNIRWQRSLD
jgi:eukaryotic-like serine/threonine-protein kinase